MYNNQVGITTGFSFKHLELVEVLPTPVFSCLVEARGDVFVATCVGQVRGANRWLLRESHHYGGFEPWWLEALRDGRTTLGCVFQDGAIAVLDDREGDWCWGNIVSPSRIPQSYFDAMSG